MIDAVSDGRPWVVFAGRFGVVCQLLPVVNWSLLTLQPSSCLSVVSGTPRSIGNDLQTIAARCRGVAAVQQTHE